MRVPISFSALAAACCALALLGAPAAADDRIMVRVAESAVTYADMRDEARFWRLNEAGDDEIEGLVFDMIDRRVLLEGPAKRLRLDEDEIARAARVADEAMASLGRRMGGPEGLHRTLTGMGWDLARLRQFLERRARENLLIRKLVASRVAAFEPGEVRAFERELKAKGEPVNVYALRLIECRFDPEAGRDALLAARDRAFEALLRLERGDAFERVASEMSDDPVSRARGGFAGEMADNDLRPEFLAALESLRDERTTKPVRSGNSYYILDVVGRRSPARLLRAERLAEAKDEVLAEARKTVRTRFVDPELIEMGMRERYAARAREQQARAEASAPPEPPKKRGQAQRGQPRQR